MAAFSNESVPGSLYTGDNIDKAEFSHLFFYKLQWHLFEVKKVSLRIRNCVLFEAGQV